MLGKLFGYESLELRSEISDFITLLFWLRSFGTRSVVSWEEFSERFVKDYPTPSNCSAMSHFKQLLCGFTSHHGSELVTAHRLGKLVPTSSGL